MRAWTSCSSLRVLVLLFASATLWTACGPVTGTAPGSSGAADVAGTPQRGGTLVFPGAQPPVTLNPFSGGVGANVNLSPIFEGLVRPAYRSRQVLCK